MFLSKGGFTKSDLDRVSFSLKLKYLEELVEIFRMVNDPNYKKVGNDRIRTLEDENKEEEDFERKRRRD
jgi:hypothetical protein